MQKRKETAEIAPRLLTIQNLMNYTGLGQNSADKWASQIGAKRRVGTRVVYDRTIIDTALDSLDGERIV